MPALLAVLITSKINKESYLLSVEDNGPGLPETLVNDIFTPFIRSHNVEKITGSGLGLSVVKAIAQAHGGSITYQKSSLGGAGFYLSLPMN
jgi:two-component system sensor histidine kinase AdeS